MANKRGNNIQVGDFTPRVTPSLGTGAIERPDGSAERSLAKGLGGLAEEAATFADRAAREEGKRAGDIAGADPSWRPTGSWTIRGQASDAAGTATYLNNLDAKMRSGMTELFQQHENDPVALNAAFDTMKAQLMKEDVFPEIQSSYDAAFERLRLPFRLRAIENRETRERDTLRASAVVAQGAGETLREQTIRANPAAPETRQSIEATLAEDDHRDRGLVASEAITAEQAAARAIKRRRDAEVTIVDETAQRLISATAVADYRKQLRENFTGGKTKLDAEGFEKADALLAQREQQVKGRVAQGRETVQRTLRRIADQYAGGVESNKDEVEALKAQAAQIPDGDQIVRDFDQRILLAGQVRSRSPAQLDAMADQVLAKAREDKRGLTSEEGERLEFLRKQANEKRQALATDPLAHARKHGLVEAPPLTVPDQGDAAAVVAAQMPSRIAAARAAAAAQGGEVRFLTSDDRAQLKAVAERGGERALAAVKGLVQGAGADAPAILREIGGDAPELAKAGDLLVNGGPGADQTAREITAALDLRQVKDARLPEPPKGAAQLMRDELGSAYLNSPQAQAQISAAARAIYQRRAFGKVTDANSSEAQELYRESLRAAAGAGKSGDTTYGGVVNYRPGYLWKYKVAIPPNVRSDRFGEVMGAIRDEDLGGATDPAGKPIRARDLRGAIPVRVKGGYAFSLDDPSEASPRFLGRPGQPLVLDIEGLAPELRKRVPDAYLGGDR